MTKRSPLAPGWFSEFAGSAGLLFVAVSAIRLTAPNGALASLDRLFDGRTLVIGCAIAGEVALFGVTRWVDAPVGS